MGFNLVKDTRLDARTRLIQLAPPNSTVPTLILFPKSSITIHESKPLPIIVFRTENIERTLEQMRNKGIVISHNQMKLTIGLHTTFQDNEGNEYIILENDDNKLALEFEV